MADAPARLPPWKRVLFRAIQLALAALCAALFLEIALRLQGEAADPEIARHRAIRAATTPKNPARNRDYTYEPGRQPGVYRIASIGDSFTYGAGVYFDDSYPKRLERKLNACCPGRRFEVLNYGRPGANSRAQVGLLKSSFRYEPDLVTIGFCLNDAETFDGGNREAARQVLAAPEPSLLGAKLRSFSRLYTRASDALAARIVTGRSIEYMRGLYRAESAGWLNCETSLRKMAGMCQGRNVRPVLVIFPLFFGRAFDDSYPFRGVHEQVAGTAAGFGYEVVDLLPAYEGMRTLRLVAHPTLDGHPNEMAHRIAADAIFEKLVKIGAAGGCGGAQEPIPSEWAGGSTTTESVRAP